jgi:triacylglycerol esterase/lipase EstA (alpha/beta hydrolase family)
LFPMTSRVPIARAVALLVLACMLTIPLASAQHLYPANRAIPSMQTHATRALSGKVSATTTTPALESGLEAYGATPLGNRTPLLLVHGIGGTGTRYYHWENFLEFVDKHPAFEQKYKIYLYHYDSTRSVPNISADLQAHMKTLLRSVNDRPIKVLAYSEGGLLVRNALQDGYLDDHTQEVLAIATPFHGSPLANPEWIQQQVKTESPLSMVRLFQKIAYHITGDKYPTFQQDFHWDNFDGAIPADQYFKSNGTNPTVSYLLAKKSKFVTYGSYFGMDVDSSLLQQELGLKSPLPKERPMPSNLFRKNFLFSLIRNNIGRLPLAPKLVRKDIVATQPVKGIVAAVEPPISLVKDLALATVAPALPETVASTAALSSTLAASASPVKQLPEKRTHEIPILGLAQSFVSPPEPKSTDLLMASTTPSSLPAKIALLKNPLEPVSMMMFNDGISPISSTLWLGRYIDCHTGSSIPVSSLWDTLKTLKGNPNTRLFAGLDHRNWMDGNTRTGQGTVSDLLNPEEPPRTVFEWIIYDLMS